MPFKKGQTPPQRKKRGPSNKNPEDKNKGSLQTYPMHKHWQKMSSRRTLDIQDIDYYIYNDLPIDELYDEMNLRDWKYKYGNTKKTSDDEGM